MPPLHNISYYEKSTGQFRSVLFSCSKSFGASMHEINQSQSKPIQTNPNQSKRQKTDGLFCVLRPI